MDSYQGGDKVKNELGMRQVQATWNPKRKAGYLRPQSHIYLGIKIAWPAYY
jgi:hypothetical protein